MFRKYIPIIFLLTAYLITFAHNIIPHHHDEHGGHTHHIESRVHSEYHTTEHHHHHHENKTDDESEENTLIHLFSFLFHSEGGIVFLNAHNVSFTHQYDFSFSALAIEVKPYIPLYNLPNIRLLPNNNSPCLTEYLKIGSLGLRAPPILFS